MKRIWTLVLSLLLLLGLFAGCSSDSAQQIPSTDMVNGYTNTAGSGQTGTTQTQNEEPESAQLKYVFLFIGDGMSYPQIQATADYLGASKDEDYMQAEPSLSDNGGAVLDGPETLNFMSFQAAGSAVTYDSSSFCPDSASTATSISTGHKTYSGSINVDETATICYETIMEKVHAQLGWKVGVISSVNLNHATPAAFYAHQASRNDYYEIGVELVESGFEYFAGGGLKKADGADANNPQQNLYVLAEAAGYTVSFTIADAEKITTADGKVILIDEHLADSDAMAYEIDCKEDMWSLADYVEKGIEVLNNDTGFFIMCEGGKIDWACHANDAATTIQDTVAFADAVAVAIEFAAQHPEETLILVTGDHETGGMTIGFAGTDYDTYLTLLQNQKISFTQYDEQYVAKYKAEKTDFETVLAEIEMLFGLKSTGDAQDKMVLTEYELALLHSAYEKSVNGASTSDFEQQEYVLYGTYDPLSVTITHIINNKSGISFTSYSHTGVPVGVFAEGIGADIFNGYYDNTEIYNKLAAMLDIE